MFGYKKHIEWPPFVENDGSKNIKLSELNLKYLTKIIDLCEQNNRKVILIRSPLHSKSESYASENIYQQIREKESLFKNGDCVIIQLTNLYREWFFENKPYMAVHMAVEMTAGVDVTEEQHKALEMYKRHLYSERRLILHYNALLDALSFRIKLWEDQGIKCLVLPAFHNLPGVEGNLCEVSGSEFDSEKTSMMYHEKTGDLRFNHFSEVNHKILADKIINFFTNNKNVNLKTGFETMLLTKDNI